VRRVGKTYPFTSDPTAMSKEVQVFMYQKTKESEEELKEALKKETIHKTAELDTDKYTSAKPEVQYYIATKDMLDLLKKLKKCKANKERIEKENPNIKDRFVDEIMKLYPNIKLDEDVLNAYKSSRPQQQTVTPDSTDSPSKVRKTDQQDPMKQEDLIPK
jgi:hypothetical protein